MTPELIALALFLAFIGCIALLRAGYAVENAQTAEDQPESPVVMGYPVEYWESVLNS